MYRILVFCVLLIGLVSVYDTYLTIIYSSSLSYLEQNPVCQYILSVGGLELFVQLKSLLTIIVALICYLLISTKYKIVIPAILSFQIFLFIYLNFYTYREGFVFNLRGSPIMDLYHYYFYPEDFFDFIEPFPKFKS